MRNRYLLLPVFSLALSLTACEKTAAPAPPPPALTNPFARNEEVLKYEMTSEKLARQDAADEIPLAIKDQCARQICGDPASTFTASDILRGDFENVAENAAIVDRELKPLLVAILDKSVEASQEVVAQAERRLPYLSDLKLSRKYTAMIHFLWLSAHLKNFADGLRGHAGSYTIDEAAVAASDLTADERSYMMMLVLDLVNSEEFKHYEFMDQVTLAEYLRSSSSSTSNVTEAEKALGRQFQSVYDTLAVQFPELRLMAPPEIRLLIEGKPLSLDLEKNLSRNFIFQYMLRTLTDKAALYNLRPVPVARILGQLKTSGYLEKARSALSENAIRDERSAGFEQCRVFVAATVLAAPTFDELERFKSTLAVVKESVLRVAAGFRPDVSTLSHVAATLSRISFNLPLARSEVLASVERSVRAARDSSDGTARSMRELSDEALLLVLFRAQENGDPRLATDLISACRASHPGGISDNALPWMGEVNLSWETIRFPGYGIGIVAHELGHVLSYNMRYGTPNVPAAFACTNMRHGRLDAQHEGLYQEEDFADLVGARVMADLDARRVVSENQGCLLMGENNSRWGLQGLSLRAASSVIDGHATSFFRTIQIQLNSQRPLAAACRSILETYAPEAQASCFR